MASLIITTDEEKHGFELPAILGREVIVGSDESCDISLNGAEGVSHRHCSILCTEEGFLIEDLDSRNGTFANVDEVTEPTLMREGVVYTMGKASMLIAELTPYKPIDPDAAPNEEQEEEEPEKKEEPKPTKTQAATAPLEEEPKAPAAPAPIPLTREVPTPGPRKLITGKQKRRALSAQELQNKATLLAQSFKNNGVSTLYVVVIIIAAFYAGMSLYSWKSEGTPVPSLFR